MADKKITELNLHTSLALSDVIAIVNSGETKKTTYGSLYYGIRDGVVSGSSQIILGDTNGFTSYSSSVESKIYNLTSATSSYATIPQLLGEVSAINTKITSLNNFTSSQEDFNDTVMITGSLSDTTLTFTKGDSSTFNIDLSESFITPSQTGSFVESSYISCYSTASQQLVESGSAQAVTFTSLWTQNGISLVDGTKLTMEKQGVYQFNFVAQLTNPDNEVHEAYFWIKYNGSNFPNSTTKMTLPTRKDSGTASSQLMTMNIVGQNMVDNGYIELWWTGDSTLLLLQETPAFGPVPETPSIIAHIIRVG